jgi:hypothetical protein
MLVGAAREGLLGRRQELGAKTQSLDGQTTAGEMRIIDYKRSV